MNDAMILQVIFIYFLISPIQLLYSVTVYGTEWSFYVLMYQLRNYSLLNDLGRRISLNLGEARETSFLYQRILVLVRRFNTVLLHDSLPAFDSTDLRSYLVFLFLI